jgi:hypothetical protein
MERGEAYQSHLETAKIARTLDDELNSIKTRIETIAIHFSLENSIYAKDICLQSELLYRDAEKYKRTHPQQEKELKKLQKYAKQTVTQLIAHFENKPNYDISKLKQYTFKIVEPPTIQSPIHPTEEPTQTPLEPAEEVKEYDIKDDYQKKLEEAETQIMEKPKEEYQLIEKDAIPEIIETTPPPKELTLDEKIERARKEIERATNQLNKQESSGTHPGGKEIDLQPIEQTLPNPAMHNPNLPSLDTSKFDHEDSQPSQSEQE